MAPVKLLWQVGEVFSRELDETWSAFGLLSSFSSRHSIEVSKGLLLELRMSLGCPGLGFYQIELVHELAMVLELLREPSSFLGRGSLCIFFSAKRLFVFF